MRWSSYKILSSHVPKEQLEVMALQDARTGEILTQIARTEPDSSLFQIPSGYTSMSPTQQPPR